METATQAPTETHTSPDSLTRYAFYWSLARMGIAVLSLFFGATPIVTQFMIGASGLLPLAWLVSGVASVYLGYRWYTGGKSVFGGKNQKDTIAFLVMVVTGLNLGYTAIGTNIGMNLTGSIVGYTADDFVYKATAVLYAFVAYYLYKRFKENGERVV